MLLPEARLDVLVEQLESLPRGDRKAVLARLLPREREQLRARMDAAVATRPASPYSPDIAQRVAAAAVSDPALPMTASGRAALARALESGGEEQPSAAAGSLMDAVAGLFASWRRGA